MKELSLIIFTLLTFQLIAQDYEFTVENSPETHSLITFPNLDANEIYTIAFKNDKTGNPKNAMWIMDIEADTLTKKMLPSYILGNITEAKNLFYYSNHIYCLKKTADFRSLVLQPLPIKGKTATKNPQFISLSKLREDYLTSKFIEDYLYVFTASKKKRLIKIYRVDLKDEKVEIMEIPVKNEDLSALKVGAFHDESDFIKVFDVKDFSHPNQLLIKNKIYFEEDKIVLLLQSLDDNTRNIIYKVDYDKKDYSRKSLLFANANFDVNAAYHDNYLYRFCGSYNNMIIEMIGLDSIKKTSRYVVDKNHVETPFQKNKPKKISFFSTVSPSFVINHTFKSFFKKPVPRRNHRSVCLIEYDNNNVTTYIGYTELEVQQTSYHQEFGPTFKYFSPKELNYYLMETKFPFADSSETTDGEEEFRVPTFVRLISKCHSEMLEVKSYDPNAHKHKLFDIIGGVQIIRMEKEFYGAFFNPTTSTYHFKKLLDVK